MTSSSTWWTISHRTKLCIYPFFWYDAISFVLPFDVLVLGEEENLIRERFVRLNSIWWWKCNFNLLFNDDISSHIIALVCDIANLYQPCARSESLVFWVTNVYFPMNFIKLTSSVFLPETNSIIYVECFGISSRIDGEWNGLIRIHEFLNRAETIWLSSWDIRISETNLLRRGDRRQEKS